MTRIRQNLLPLYLIAAVIAAGHAGSDAYAEARRDGRAMEDAALIAGVAGIMGGAVWPGYAAAKVWGRANG